MVLSAARTARVARAVRRAAPRRAFSSGASHADHMAEVQKWKKVSVAALPFIGVFAAFNVWYEGQHHAEHAKHVNKSYAYFHVI